MFDLAIVGGGASGMMAAISAAMARPGTAIVLLERLDRVGKKLLATGNGRCNLTNSHSAELYGNNRLLMESVCERFDHNKTVELFERLGLLCTEHESGRIYPYSMQASAVLETLRNAMFTFGVMQRCDFHVESIANRDGHFVIRPQQGQPISARKVLMAAGGKASPSLGSDGSGFQLAAQLGHSIIKIYPALVQLKSDNPACSVLNGIRANANAVAYVGGEQVGAECGEIQFTGYGLSGIPVMQLSRHYAYSKDMTLVLDFMPEYTHDILLQLLLDRQQSGMHATLESFLVGMVNKKLGYALLKAVGLSPLSLPVSDLSCDNMRAITDALKGFEFRITGDMSFNNAQVTAGGVDSNEFDTSTLASLKVDGLYAAGELLDIYGDCGGHNLQWAWATGHIAGSAAARSLD